MQKLIIYSLLSLGFLSSMKASSASAKEPQEAAAAQLSQETAKAFISSIGKEAISILTNKHNTRPEREQGFKTILEKAFDTKAIGRFSLGRYWKRASSEEKATYLTLFKDMIVQSYTTRFQNYSGEKFDIMGAYAQKDGGVTVQSEIINPNGGAPIKVDWRVYPTKTQGTRILDVLVEGVSMSITQRSDFAGIIERRGGSIQGLLDELGEKTKK